MWDSPFPFLQFHFRLKSLHISDPDPPDLSLPHQPLHFLLPLPPLTQDDCCCPWTDDNQQLGQSQDPAVKQLRRRAVRNNGEQPRSSYAVHYAAPAPEAAPGTTAAEWHTARCRTQAKELHLPVERCHSKVTDSFHTTIHFISNYVKPCAI